MNPDIYPTERLSKLPTYLFVEIDKLKREALYKHIDIIDLGVGDPDLPTPSFIVEELARAVKDPNNHHYPTDWGLSQLREAIAEWYKKRFGVHLDSDREVLPLIGSKEGIAHLPLALLNPEDVVLIPDPGYPPYRSGTIFAGAEPYALPLLERNGFLPDLTRVNRRTLQKARLIFLNYPNNPTAACAPAQFFQEVVHFAKENNLVVAHDAAYTEIAFDEYRPSSFLAQRGAKDVGIEFHSLSKTFCMTGWRIGFAVGNAQVLKLLSKVKTNIDSGIFQAIQLAAIKALKEGESVSREIAKVYESRRNLVVEGLNSLGWNLALPKATFYLWVPVPPGYTSAELSLKFLKEARVVVVPGNGFGPYGEGYFRIALTVEEARLKEAIRRIKTIHN